MSRLWLFFLMLLPVGAAASAPRVLVTIAPIHSLVAGVTQGVGEPQLLLPAGSSPHNYALRPSDARRLDTADLIVWVGEPLERFLVKPLSTLSTPEALLTLVELPELKLIDAETNAHARDPHHDTDHHHGTLDPHLWLDPYNAKVIVAAVAARLSQLDPANAARYRANAEHLEARLQQLDNRLRERLQPVRNLPYVVFHDGYRYFEQRYDLHPIGAIALNPEQGVGARQLANIHARIEDSGARCVFREPQFTPKLAKTVTRGTPAKLGVLDPLGAELEPGPEAYVLLMENLADALVNCLAR